MSKTAALTVGGIPETLEEVVPEPRPMPPLSRPRSGGAVRYAVRAVIYGPPMALVRFAFAENVALDEHDALALAELLTLEHNFAARSAGRKIREQAKRDFERGETSVDVDLDPVELQVTFAMLRAVPIEQMSEPRSSAGRR